MEKTAEYIERYWIWIFLGLILTRIEVEKMYEVRGGFCIGGEWLIVPLIIFITVFVSQMIKDFRETLWEEEDAGETMGDYWGMAG